MVKRRRFRKKRSGMAKKALTMVRKLKRELKPEMKRKTIVVNNLDIDSTGLIQDVPRLADGTQQSARTGLDVRCKTLQLTSYIFRNAVATTTFCRLIVFVDKQQIADSKTSVADVLETVSVLAPRNQLTKKRFRFLRDKYFFLTSTFDARIFRMRIKLNFIQRYNGTATTDIEKNGIYILLLSNQATNKPSITYHATISYTDV